MLNFKLLNKIFKKIGVSLFSLLLLILIMNFNTEAQTIVINEILASNATGITDEDGDNEDWIELYNYGEEDIDLSGFYLSDDYDDPFMWEIPDVSIEAGGFILFWASGKDRKDPDAPLHTNFRIAQSGEEILLTNPEGTRIDELEPTEIPTDISYGRKPDGSDDWYYFEEPTPGYTNNTEGFSEILKPPIFSKKGGFYTKSFNLELSHDDPDVEIIYTLDGSEPCINNLNGTTYYYKNQYPQNPGNPFGDLIPATYKSKKYNEPINIKYRTFENDKLTQISTTWHLYPDYFPENNVDKANIVRAKAFKKGAIPSSEKTHAYYINLEKQDKYSLPVIFINLNEDYLFDYYKGIYVAGVDFDKWRENNPDQKADGHASANYRRRGIEFEYPANFQYFEATKKDAIINQNIGIRIHGGWSRSNPLKSLRLYARNKYTNSTLDHAFFNDTTHDSFKRLILRNSGNDYFSTFFRDALIQNIVSHMNFDTQAYQPAILFINGEYWGIHNIRERYDKHYLNRVYGVDPDNIDLLTGSSYSKEGDSEHYTSTINYIEEYGLKEDEHYEYILTRIDTENFIDYQIANIYANNTDWPGNNIDFWRLRTEKFHEDADYGHDGRWRWLLFDTDFGFGLSGEEKASKHNALTFATEEGGTGWPNPDWSTFLLRELLKNEQFKTKFITRFADQLNSGFTPKRTINLINEFKKQLEPEIEQHIERWSKPDCKDVWKNNIAVMTDFAENRPRYQRNHIIDYFDLDGTFNVKLDVSNQLKGHIRINTIEIESFTPGVSKYPYPWNGIYFKNVPIELEAIPKPGYKFSHWKGDINSTSKIIEINRNKDIEVKAVFEKTGKSTLIHYWLFDTEMPNDTPLEYLESHYSVPETGIIEYKSCLDGYPFDENHPKWRKASMERRNAPTPVNYRPEGNDNIGYNDVDMRGLQIRQPFVDNGNENIMILNMPTTGFSDITMRFAAIDEDAVEKLIIDYSTDSENINWTSSGMGSNEFLLKEVYDFFEIDFHGIKAVENNPDFKVRIRFEGENLDEDDENRATFNNISLEGKAIGAHTIFSSHGHNGEIKPSGDIPVYNGGDKEFFIGPAENHYISSVLVDGKCKLHEIIPNEDNSAFYVFNNVTQDHEIFVEFSINPEIIKTHDDGVIIYPNPANNKITVSSLSEIKSIDIITINGRIIKTYDQVNLKNFIINTGLLQKGIYILRVDTVQGTVSKKIQIIRQ